MELTSSLVKSPASCLLVSVEGIGGEQDQGCASIDNTSSGTQDRRSTIRHRLINTPVPTSRAGTSNRYIGNISCSLGRVGCAEVQLSGSIRLSGRDVVDTNEICTDGTSREKAVGDGGYRLATWECAFRQADGADSKDAIDAVESLRTWCNADSKTVLLTLFKV